MRKGFDPRDFALVAEGGAGPLFAAQIAPEVGTPAVLVPPYPGVTAALGLLATDMVYEYVATSYQRALATLDARRRSRSSSRSSRSRRGAARAGRHPARTACCSSASPTAATWARATSCASTSASGAIDDGVDRRAREPTSTTSTSASTRAASRTSDVQIANIRVRGDRADAATSRRRRPSGRRVAARRRAAPRGRRVVPRRRRAAEGRRRASTTARRCGRQRLEGPAIVNQFDSTTVVPPGLTAHGRPRSATSSSRRSAARSARPPARRR